ncbi:MAG TPA: hypothetical protein PLD59_02505 [Tepidisphaeraceae bacterium]|nr:hypothetical protein [Tepidisphaeraceae bacterium]
MSIAISQPVQLPHEPFGQTGVRQYVGSFSALFCAAMVAMCLTLWYRSFTVMDTVEFYHAQSRSLVQSAQGRLAIVNIQGSAGDGAGWGFSSRPVRRGRLDRWPDSIWKTIGVQVMSDTFSGQRAWLLRVKFPFAAAVLGVVPVVHVIKQLRMVRRRDEPDNSPRAAFCPRCGRGAGAGDSRCRCCGREFRGGSTHSIAVGA